MSILFNTSKLLKAKFIFIVIPAFIFLGCKKENPVYEPSYSSKSSVNQKKELTVGCANRSFYEPMDLVIQNINTELKDVRLKVVAGSNYENYLERLSQGEFDLSHTNGLEGLNSQKYGYKIIAKFEEDSTYYGVYYANKDAKINSIKDLKGKKFAFSGRGSIFGELCPTVEMHKNGINRSKDLIPQFFPSFETSILNVYLNKCDAGIALRSSWIRYTKEHPEILKKIKIIGRTTSFPNICIIIKKDIDPKISKEILNSYLNLHKTPKGKLALQKLGFTKVVKADSNNYISLIKLKTEFDQIQK